MEMRSKHFCANVCTIEWQKNKSRTPEQFLTKPPGISKGGFSVLQQPFIQNIVCSVKLVEALAETLGAGLKKKVFPTIILAGRIYKNTLSSSNDQHPITISTAG
jgi:hypothetical protein